MAHLGPQQVLDLQRTAGNAAVAAMVVQRKEGPGRPTLRSGSSGQDVLELQSALNHIDEVVTPLAVDGAFGPITNKVVRQFQSAHPPLMTDGVVGPLTWSAIGVARAEPQDDVVLAKKLFDRASDAHVRGKFAHAYDLLTRAEELAPHRKDLIFSRAQCLRKLGGRRPEAIALYERYIAEGGGRSAEAAVHLAELKGPAATGDTDTDTAAAKVLFDKACALFVAGKYGHAYDDLTRAEELAPHRKDLIFSRAQCLRKLGGRRPEAIALYERYMAEGGGRSAEAAAHVAELKGPAATGDNTADTATAKVLFDKAVVLYARGQYGHAYDELTKADELTHRAGLTFSRAQCLRKLGGRREEAVALYEQYLAESPTGEWARQARFYASELRTQGAAP